MPCCDRADQVGRPLRCGQPGLVVHLAPLLEHLAHPHAVAAAPQLTGGASHDPQHRIVPASTDHHRPGGNRDEHREAGRVQGRHRRCREGLAEWGRRQARHAGGTQGTSRGCAPDTASAVHEVEP